MMPGMDRTLAVCYPQLTPSQEVQLFCEMLLTTSVAPITTQAESYDALADCVRDPRSMFHQGYRLPPAGLLRSFQKVTQDCIIQEAWALSWYLVYGLYSRSHGLIPLRSLDAEIAEECSGLCQCIISVRNLRLRDLLALKRAGYSHLAPLVRTPAADPRSLDQLMLSCCDSVDFYVLLYRSIANRPITYQAFRYVRSISDGLYRSVCFSLGVPLRQIHHDMEHVDREPRKMTSPRMADEY